MGDSMAPIREPIQSFGRVQIVNAAVEALTILGAAVVVRASDNFSYLLLEEAGAAV